MTAGGWHCALPPTAVTAEEPLERVLRRGALSRDSAATESNRFESIASIAECAICFTPRGGNRARMCVRHANPRLSFPACLVCRCEIFARSDEFGLEEPRFRLGALRQRERRRSVPKLCSIPCPSVMPRHRPRRSFTSRVIPSIRSPSAACARRSSAHCSSDLRSAASVAACASTACRIDPH